MINGRVDPQSLRSKPPSSSPCLRNPSDGVYPLYPPQPLGPLTCWIRVGLLLSGMLPLKIGSSCCWTLSTPLEAS